MEETTSVVLELDGSIDTELANGVSKEMAVETRALAKHGLDGDVASWLLIGNFLVTSLAALAPILSKYLGDRRVKSIRIGELTIENPRQEDIARILTDWRGGGNGPAG